MCVILHAFVDSLPPCPPLQNVPSQFARYTKLSGFITLKSCNVPFTYLSRTNIGHACVRQRRLNRACIDFPRSTAARKKKGHGLLSSSVPLLIVAIGDVFAKLQTSPCVHTESRRYFKTKGVRVYVFLIEFVHIHLCIDLLLLCLSLFFCNKEQWCAGRTAGIKNKRNLCLPKDPVSFESLYIVIGICEAHVG